jgi:hypothetical protein
MRFTAEQMAWPSKMTDSADVKLPSKKMEISMSAEEKNADMQLIGLADKNTSDRHMSVELKVRHMAVEIACLNEKYMSAEMKNMLAKIKNICVGQDKK